MTGRLPAPRSPIRGAGAPAFILPWLQRITGAAAEDVGELGDIDVDHQAGVGIFVVEPGYTGDTLMHDDRLIWHRTGTACTVEADIASRLAICIGPNRFRQCNVI